MLHKLSWQEAALNEKPAVASTDQGGSTQQSSHHNAPHDSECDALQGEQELGQKSNTPACLH
jgi:hypothetical protein